jgi:hypothetical protein
MLFMLSATPFLPSCFIAFYFCLHHLFESKLLLPACLPVFESLPSSLYLHPTFVSIPPFLHDCQPASLFWLPICLCVFACLPALP